MTMNYEAIGKYTVLHAQLEPLVKVRNDALKDIERLVQYAAAGSAIHVAAGLDCARLAELCRQAAMRHEALVAAVNEINIVAAEAGKPALTFSGG